VAVRDGPSMTTPSSLPEDSGPSGTDSSLSPPKTDLFRAEGVGSGVGSTA
jgi:hypothetical protein